MSKKICKCCEEFIEKINGEDPWENPDFCSEQCEDDYRHAKELEERFSKFGCPDSQACEDFVRMNW